MRNTTIVSLAALAVAGVANAEFVDVQFTGAGAGHMVTIASPGHNGAAFAGQIYITISNSSDPTLNGAWISYCTDLAQTVNEALTPYELLPVALLPQGSPMGLLKAAAITDLYNFANGAQFGVDNDIAAAFQLAMWEIVTDYSGGPAFIGDIGTGAFQASDLTAGTTAYLALLMAAIGTQGPYPGYLQGLGNGEWQDQIIEVSHDVPGPGAVAVGAFGMLLAGRRRRR